jgi:eukaryotic-like serine/threonine-protein kinase
MVSFDGNKIVNAKIIDLGLAKGGAEDAVSIQGTFAGTPEYASPEQLTGVGADIRSDLNSLGITLGRCSPARCPSVVLRPM